MKWGIYITVRSDQAEPPFISGYKTRVLDEIHVVYVDSFIVAQTLSKTLTEAGYENVTGEIVPLPAVSWVPPAGYPLRTELMVLPADEPGEPTLGVKMYEFMGEAYSTK
jgi:hypothetical protein